MSPLSVVSVKSSKPPYRATRANTALAPVSESGGPRRFQRAWRTWLAAKETHIEAFVDNVSRLSKERQALLFAPDAQGVRFATTVLNRALASDNVDTFILARQLACKNYQLAHPQALGPGPYAFASEDKILQRVQHGQCLKIGAALAERGEIGAEAYLACGHPSSFAQGIKWLQRNTIPLSTLVKVWPTVTPERIVPMVFDANVSGIDFLRSFTGRVDAVAPARIMLSQGLIAAYDMAQFLPIDDQEGAAWVQEGRLDADSFLKFWPQPSVGSVARLRAAGKFNISQCLRSGAMNAKEIDQALKDHLTKAREVLCQQRVSKKTIETWYIHGLIGADAYEQHRLDNWQPHMPLTMTHQRRAVYAKSPSELLLHAEPFAAVEHSMRASFWWRLLAVHAQSDQMYRKRRPLRNKAMTIKSSHRACIKCQHDFCGDQPAAVVPHCYHAPEMCQPCWLQTMCTQPHTQCPTPKCNHEITAEHMVLLGASAQEAMRYAKSIVIARFHEQKDWRSCKTRDCPGGLMMAAPLATPFHCPVCETHQTLRP